MIGRLNHVGVATPSIDESVKLYRDVLGATAIHDKFALPDTRQYPIDTAARVRNAAARLEQNKTSLPPEKYARARARIAAMPDGVYDYETFLDDGVFVSKPTAVRFNHKHGHNKCDGTA